MDTFLFLMSVSSILFLILYWKHDVSSWMETIVFKIRQYFKRLREIKNDRME